MHKKAPKSNENLLDFYFKQIKVYPLLSFEEELELSRKIQNGSKGVSQIALHKLVNSNLRLVVKIASLYNVSKASLMDIIQEGNIGLLQAAGKYDYRKNVRFCTYASWWIRQFITRYITNKQRIVRLPQRKEETLRRIQQTYHSLCQTLMHQPTNIDIAKELGIPVKDVDSFTNIASESIPFDYSDSSVSVMDIHEDYTYSPEQYLMKQVSRDGTMRILNKLKDRERRIINYRFQLNGSEYYTLREIGNKMDISPESVRQIEMRALRKIRTHAEELREYVYVEAI
ncbi:MAG: RNA polymerase sigma factor RpoD/SigA [Treponema sp.]|jgi:RNA polymerase primary sigma factor|nr:RNA polymerase sigma factor RpoD/SigA [Treponema sp.]